MDALQSMRTYLATRPAGFASLPAAIEWHVRSRTVRNSASARTSVPALVREERPPPGAAGPSSPSAPPPASRPWRWRTDLAATQPFWEGWFVGLSRKFLEAKGGKLLLLAGTDRLDTELTIGQMQGALSPACSNGRASLLTRLHAEREVQPPSVPGGGPLYSRGPARENSHSPGRLLPPKRQERLGTAPQGIGSAGTGEEGLENVARNRLVYLARSDVRMANTTLRLILSAPFRARIRPASIGAALALASNWYIRV